MAVLMAIRRMLAGILLLGMSGTLIELLLLAGPET